MSDSIFAGWLTTQGDECMAFAQRSSVLNLAPVAGDPPFRYIAQFECAGLMQTDDGIVVCDRHLVGINFPLNYLRVSCHPGEVLTWLEPQAEFHPNIKAPYACIGHIAPGMTLMSLLQQLYTMITWQRFTAREDDALNRDACRWARNNLERFPIDPRRSMLDGGVERSAPVSTRVNADE